MSMGGWMDLRKAILRTALLKTKSKRIQRSIKIDKQRKILDKQRHAKEKGRRQTGMLTCVDFQIKSIPKKCLQKHSKNV
jgi:hypothetical protein